MRLYGGSCQGAIFRPFCSELPRDAKILDLGERMHAESAYAFLPYDRDKVRRLVRSHLNDPAESCVFVLRSADRTVGMLLGVRHPVSYEPSSGGPSSMALASSASGSPQPGRTARLYERMRLMCAGGTFKQVGR